METIRWDVIIEVFAVCVSGIASSVAAYYAIKGDLILIHANIEFLKKDHEELKKDFKAHMTGSHLHYRQTD